MLRANPILPLRRSLPQSALQALSVCVLLTMLLLFLIHCPVAFAQSTAQPSTTSPSAPVKTSSTATSSTKSTHPARLNRARHHRAKPQKPAPKEAAAPPPAIPPPPPPPDWPALKPPTPAQIHWDGKQLTIAANNSSLQEVIASISAQTHVPVTGLQSDQRLFGNYGPGTPQQVLAELLEGSGYDLLIIDGKSAGIPQRVELTRRGSGSIQPDRPSYNPPPPGAQPVNPALAQQMLNPPAPPPGVAQPGMTPQQLIQQRMQQMRQQQGTAQPQQ